MWVDSIRIIIMFRNIQKFQKMKEQKSNLEIGTEKLKGSIERLTRKRFSDFIKIYWKSVNLGKKA